MSKISVIQHFRGSGAPLSPEEGVSLLTAGEIAIDTSNNVIWAGTTSDGLMTPVGVLTESDIAMSTNTNLDFKGALWLDSSSSSIGIPATYQVAANFDVAQAGQYVLDAYQGHLLAESVSALTTSINNLSTDYIVEQGTSNGWTYRKWNSGVAECWAQPSLTTTISTAWGGGYYSGSGNYLSRDYPSGLFVARPILTFSPQNTVSASFIPMSGSGGSSTATGHIFLFRGASQTAEYTYYIGLYAIGRWKS